MKKNKLTELTNEELQIEKKKLKKRKFLKALLIGVLVGVLFILGAATVHYESPFGFIPVFILLFIIVKIVKSPDKDKILEETLKERNIN
ncbi:hypothetical protein [Ancylomarina sp. 16SWW S1-10-2]|uniref:hypothetical protein n=1 Tax=Ancylomarina sp. 16SWW S1-10-2 TaxID=2499681 RepID=UPI0012AD6115|nr:hypothetical protein [Ancylomarina sp. 16SWW S1-10-2]MRT92236.1 hypothetical protein [Ancylomarina sp. 16SWW S1-10-2]